LFKFCTPNYPRAEGFAYVIGAIEKYMAEKGVPGAAAAEDLMDGGCLEMEENTIEEQLVTVEVTENVRIWAILGSDSMIHCLWCV
jgi:hypothetical protein